MSELKKRLHQWRVDSWPYSLESCQIEAIQEFVREVNRKVDYQYIGAPEAIRDTLKELGIEL